MESYILVTGAAIVSIGLWLFMLYREFGMSQEKLRKAQSAKRQKFTRAEPSRDDRHAKPRRKTRAFGNR